MEPGWLLVGAAFLAGVALGCGIERARERRKRRLLEDEIGLSRPRSRSRPEPSWQDETWIRRRNVRVEDHPTVADEILEEAEYDWRRAHG